MNRARNMPPAARSRYWDAEMFCLAEPKKPSDPFASIANDVADMLLDLDGSDAKKLDAVAGIRAVLWASGLTLSDLALWINGKSARPRSQD